MKRKRNEASKSRNWVVTQQDPTVTAYRPKELYKTVNYMISRYEVGEKTGNIHIQMFIQFNNALPGSSIEKVLRSSSYHAERATGTPLQAAAYCGAVKESKHYEKPGAMNNTVIELGERDETTQGAREDLKRLAATAKDLGENATAHLYPEMYIKYHRGIKALIEQLEPVVLRREIVPICHNFWGKTGRGKSEKAYKLAKKLGYKDHQIYMQSGTKWWDGYRGQPVVIVNEFDGTGWTCNMFKKITDRWFHQVEVKGSFRTLKVEHFIFTSQQRCDTWYKNMPMEDQEAVMRRFKNIKEINHTKQAHPV